MRALKLAARCARACACAATQAASVAACTAAAAFAAAASARRPVSPIEAPVAVEAVPVNRCATGIRVGSQADEGVLISLHFVCAGLS